MRGIHIYIYIILLSNSFTLRDCLARRCVIVLYTHNLIVIKIREQEKKRRKKRYSRRSPFVVGGVKPISIYEKKKQNTYIRY